MRDRSAPRGSAAFQRVGLRHSSVTSIINDVVDEFVSTSQSMLPQLNSTSPSITSRSPSLESQFTDVSTGPFSLSYVDDMLVPYTNPMTALSPTHTIAADNAIGTGYVGLANEPQLQLQTYEQRQGAEGISSDSQLGLGDPANPSESANEGTLKSPVVANQTALNLGGWRKRRRHDEPEIPGFMCFQIQSGGRSFTRNGKRTRTVNERQNIREVRRLGACLRCQVYKIQVRHHVLWNMLCDEGY